MKKQIILNYGCDEVAEVQVYLYLSTSELAHQADFPAFRRGRSVRVRKDDLDEWIERKKEAGEGW